MLLDNITQLFNIGGISDIESIANDISFSNRFGGVLISPSKANISKDDKEVSKRIKTVSLPEMALTSNPHSKNGRVFNMTSNMTLGELSITFYESEEFLVTDYFSKWQEHANPTNEGNRHLRYYNDIVGTFEFFYKNIDGSTNSPITRKYKGVTPISVGTVEFDKSSKGTLQEITVTFTVEWFDK